jgi:TPP-dependent pyruvate/acetoin dehydrogenase alpha subunit
MFLARTAEERIAGLYRAGKITGGVFLGRGQEALSVATGLSLSGGDVFAPLIRDQGARFAFGEAVLDYTRTYIGSRSGPMRGRDGNIHRGRPQEGMFAMISHLGAMISVVNGALMAHRFKGIHGTVGATSIGDGSTSTGSCHEALNQAAVENLPLVVVVANNQYAYSTPNDRQFACKDLIDRAVGYGFTGHSVDGTDLLSCLDTITNAVAQARSGKGPQMIVASLLRLAGHGEHDDFSYLDPRFKSLAVGNDCVSIAQQTARSRGWADDSQLEQWRKEAEEEVESAVSLALRESAPDPSKEDWCALSERHLDENLAR